MGEIPASSWVRRGSMLVPSAPWETNRGTRNGWIEEPSVVRAADGTWMLFYSSGYTENIYDSCGIGCATAPSPLGPWTRYAPAFTAATIVNASFETSGGYLGEFVNAGVASGWTVQYDTVAAPTPTLVAGRTGLAQRIQYTPQAGDTGKHIWVRQNINLGLLRNDTVVYSIWHKGSGGGHTVKSDPVVGGSGREPVGTDGNFSPAAGWAQFVPDPGLFCLDATAGTSIMWRALCINLTADTGAIDITIDDAAMTYGIREPVKRDIIRSNVKRFGSTYYMVGSSSPNIILCSSADGIRWGSNTTILTPGAGLWDAQLTNSSLFHDDDGIWYLYYESGAFTIGVARAPAITGPYTKYAGNPLLGGDAAGRPAVHRQGAMYHMYYHGYADGSVGNIINRATAASPLGPFVPDQEPVFERVGPDEGEGLSTAQAADPYIFNDGTRWVLYYSATDWAGSSGIYPSHSKAMTAPLALDPGELPSPALAVAILSDASIFSGDTAPLALTLPCDLTGCSVSWGLATAPGRTAIITQAADIVDALAGRIAVTLGASATSSLSGYYYYEVQVTDVAWNIKTLLYGRMMIRGDVA